MLSGPAACSPSCLVLSQDPNSRIYSVRATSHGFATGLSFSRMWIGAAARSGEQACTLYPGACIKLLAKEKGTDLDVKELVSYLVQSESLELMNGWFTGSGGRHAERVWKDRLKSWALAVYRNHRWMSRLRRWLPTSVTGALCFSLPMFKVRLTCPG